MLERIKHMVVKEFIQTFRDVRMRFVIVVPPLIQLLAFGYVVTFDVNSISTAWHDLDNSFESRELARRFTASGYFIIEQYPRTEQEVRELLDNGTVLCAVQIAKGFRKDLRTGKPAAIQINVDGTDSNTATVAMNYAASIINSFSRDYSPQRLKAGPGSIDLRTRVWYNPALRSRNFNVPGVIASIIMLISLMLTTMAVVREREAGTMEQLMVTPIRPLELILGKTIPFAIVGFFDMALVTTVGVLWFDVPIKGSLLLLVFCTALYLLSILGAGLFISTISRTQQQAMMASMLFFMPAILLSGFVFPIENMPLFFQYVTYLNPLRYFLVIIRSLFLKGSGVDVLWPQMAALFTMGIAVLAVSSLRFRKRFL